VTSVDDRNRRLIVFGVTALVVATAVAWGLYLIREVLLLLYVCVLLAVGFTPAVNWFENRRVGWLKTRVSRGAAILIFYVLSIVVVLLMLGVILPPLIAQATDFSGALPGYLDRLQLYLVDRGWLHENWTWGDLVEKIPSPELAMTSLVGALESAIGALGTVATILVLPYYLLVEAEDLQSGFLQLLAPDRRALAARVTRDVTLKVGAWLGSQMLLCAIIGTMASISLWILGVPYFYVLGLIAGLGELVPVVGPLLAALPAILTGLSVSVKIAVVVAGYFGVQQII
jgi:putative permease